MASIMAGIAPWKRMVGRVCELDLGEVAAVGVEHIDSA